MGECEHLSRLSAYHDGELDAPSAAAMQEHVRQCRICEAELVRIRRLSRMLGDLPQPPLSAPAMRRLHAEAAQAGSGAIRHWAEALTAVAAAILVTFSLWLWRMPAATSPPDAIPTWEVSALQGPAERAPAALKINSRRGWSMTSPETPRMTRTKVILVICFLAAFAAGGAAGLVVKNRSDDHPRHAGPSRVAFELKLTPEQQEQMKNIWSGVEALQKQQFEQRRADANERDKAIVALLTPEQKANYEKIRQDYDRKVAELAAQQTQAREQAVERTKKEVLTDPNQVKRYDEMLKGQWGRGPGGPGGPYSHRGGSRSRPATEESNATNAPRVGE